MLNDTLIAITNIVLGIESLILGLLLIKKKTQSPVKLDFIITLISLGIASILAGFIHGNFFVQQPFIWVLVLAFVGITSWFLSSASMGLLWPAYHRQFQILFSIVTIVYGFIIWQFPFFYIAILYYVMAVGLLYYAIVNAYIKTKHRQIRYGIFAVLLLILAPLFQQSLVYINHIPGNLVYNLLMIPGIYFCFLAISAVLQKHSPYGLTDVYVNDLHSRMNETLVKLVVTPVHEEEMLSYIRQAKAISICGYRHAMGGQQFAENSLVIDMRKANKVLDFDANRGEITVQAGITWPQLMKFLHSHQKHQGPFWTFLQKQTGADNLSIGGALSANIHGRGLTFRPFVQDIISFNLIDAKGDSRLVSRKHELELFSLAIGGYGLFGVVSSVKMQLVKRCALQRKVEIISIENLPTKFKERIDEGFLYGDFQFKTNERANDFLQTGVFSCYRPIQNVIPQEDKLFLNKDDWNKLLLLAHIDKEKAFKKYSEYYLSTDGQTYWSDTHQLSFYNEKYIEYIYSFMPDFQEGSLMITEVYVPLDKITTFMQNVANDPNLRAMNVIYGTVRLIKQDTESFLAWAKQDYACIIFNLFVRHNTIGIQYAQDYFSQLIEHALTLGGSFYLTYHRFARKDQMLRAYPQFKDFLDLKLKYDPQERFQNSWYQFYKKMFFT